MNTQTFLVVGLGLLGGSLGQALQIAFPKSKVLGYSRSQSKIKLAQKKRLIHAGATDLEKVVSTASVVIICTPVNTIPSLIRSIDQFAKPGTIVTDVGSTKGAIISWVVKQKFRNISFVGSHPMAGSHLTGLEHSRKDLYRNAVVFVTKHSRIDLRAFRFVIAMWKRLRSRVTVLDPRTHDQIVAEISQFPHLVSALLVHLASDSSMRFASAGFRDTTRIAQGDPSLWLPIFLDNKEFVMQLIDKADWELKQLKGALSRKNSNFLLKFLRKSAEKRQKINLK